MPEISFFYGMRITMNPHDHNPPHFHVAYSGEDAIIDIKEGCILKGNLPVKQSRIVQAWCEIHKLELLHNWELLRSGQPSVRIKPLM